MRPTDPIHLLHAVLLAAFMTLIARPAPAQDMWQRVEAADPLARELLARMTLAEKIGQMTQAELTGLDSLDDVHTLALGSVLSGGGADPASGNSRADWTAAVAAIHAQALQTRLAIPLLYGVDAVHGHNNVVGAVVFPHNIGLGAAGDPDLVRRVAAATAAEVRATGIQWNFAPCVTVPRDIRWGRTYEGFGSDPALVARLGAAAVRGYQADLTGPAALLACAKHYVGDGGTAFGTGGRVPLDQGDTQMDEAALRRIHLAPYPDAIAAGAGSIMVSYSSWNGQKLTGHRYLLTDVLKGELGYKGFLISDYNAISQVDEDFREAVAKSINAGIDMAMEPNRFRRFITTLTSLVEEGRVPIERIDDAVLRILRVKAALGMLDPGYDPAPSPELVDAFGGESHRALAREAAAKSVVVLHNRGGILPLSESNAPITVIGRGANDLGMQCGGWTIDWQGGRGDITSGTTILTAMRDAFKAGQIITAGPFIGGTLPSSAVVVIGEEPYAEGHGDRTPLTLAEEDIRDVQIAHRFGVPVVVVILSGRPIILDPIADLADAIVAAWLPGTEGGGVADVLTGQVPATGRLSFDWTDATGKILWPVGHSTPLDRAAPIGPDSP